MKCLNSLGVVPWRDLNMHLMGFEPASPPSLSLSKDCYSELLWNIPILITRWNSPPRFLNPQLLAYEWGAHAIKLEALVPIMFLLVVLYALKIVQYFGRSRFSFGGTTTLIEK